MIRFTNAHLYTGICLILIVGVGIWKMGEMGADRLPKICMEARSRDLTPAEKDELRAYLETGSCARRLSNGR